MTDRIEDGGPAFPSTEEHPSYDIPMHHFGMSLRDWFAGQVLASAAALPLGTSDYEHRAKVAYGQADAMLEARASRPNGEAQ